MYVGKRLPCLLLELVIVHVSGVVPALFATGCLLLGGIALDGPEHSFQDRV